MALTLIAAVAPSGAGAAAAAACNPKVIDLGTLSGGDDSEIIGANRLGVWVGDSTNADGVHHAVLWRDGVIQDLGFQGFAADINSRGVVIGDSPDGGWSWYRGVRTPMKAPGWAVGTYVRHINSSSDAAGILSDADGNSFAAIWPALGEPRVLPTPVGFDSAEGTGINEAGDVVGDVWTNDFSQDVAWEWDHNGNSHALVPTAYYNGFSLATTVSYQGRAAGALDFGGQVGLWAATFQRGTITKLGQLGADLNFSLSNGEDGRGDYVGVGTYTPDDTYWKVLLAKAGTGQALTMLPLSGNMFDPSAGHAIIPPGPGTPGVSVGGSSTTAGGLRHATVWTCAYQQAFAPPGEPAPAPTKAALKAARLQLAATMQKSQVDRGLGQRLHGWLKAH